MGYRIIADGPNGTHETIDVGDNERDAKNEMTRGRGQVLWENGYSVTLVLKRDGLPDLVVMSK